MKTEKSDQALFDFCNFYKYHYNGTISDKVELFSISMQGHFHIGPSEAKELIKRCISLGYVEKISKDTIKIK